MPACSGRFLNYTQRGTESVSGVPAVARPAVRPSSGRRFTFKLPVRHLPCGG
jgi:hypothetical protein